MVSTLMMGLVQMFSAESSDRRVWPSLLMSIVKRRDHEGVVQKWKVQWILSTGLNHYPLDKAIGYLFSFANFALLTSPPPPPPPNHLIRWIAIYPVFSSVQPIYLLTRRQCVKHYFPEVWRWTKYRSVFDVSGKSSISLICNDNWDQDKTCSSECRRSRSP